MSSGLIETFYTKETGYHPFLIREHWQVAQLNYLPTHTFDTIERLDLHEHTDEVFVLVKGRAVLIAATVEDGRVGFECILMKQGVIYNIPVNTWHNIAMDEAAEIIITEKSNTHLHDCIYYPLSEADKCSLKDQLLQLINH